MFSQLEKRLTLIIAVNGLSVNAKYNFKNGPAIDILIISGGAGTRNQMKDTETINWIEKIHKKTLITANICSGARLLGVLGLLNNQQYCTHHEVYDHMLEIVPSGFPQKSKRFVSFDKIYTSGGISAGIDLSFHIIETLHGKNIAQKTADYMEYNWNGN